MHDQIISRFAKFLNLMVLFCNFLLLLIYIISNLFRNFFAFTTACTRQDNCKMMPIRSVVKNSDKNLMSFIMIHCLKLRKRTDLYNFCSYQILKDCNIVEIFLLEQDTCSLYLNFVTLFQYLLFSRQFPRLHSYLIKFLKYSAIFAV